MKFDLVLTQGEDISFDPSTWHSLSWISGDLHFGGLPDAAGF